MKIIGKPHTVMVPDVWFLNCNKKFWNSMISMWVGADDKFFKLTKSKFWERLNSNF